MYMDTPAERADFRLAIFEDTVNGIELTEPCAPSHILRDLPVSKYATPASIASFDVPRALGPHHWRSTKPFTTVYCTVLSAGIDDPCLIIPGCSFAFDSENHRCQSSQASPSCCAGGLLT
jgi:hypothetical protein